MPRGWSATGGRSSRRLGTSRQRTRSPSTPEARLSRSGSLRPGPSDPRRCRPRGDGPRSMGSRSHPHRMPPPSGPGLVSSCGAGSPATPRPPSRTRPRPRTTPPGTRRQPRPDPRRELVSSRIWTDSSMGVSLRGCRRSRGRPRCAAAPARDERHGPAPGRAAGGVRAAAQHGRRHLQLVRPRSVPSPGKRCTTPSPPSPTRASSGASSPPAPRPATRNGSATTIPPHLPNLQPDGRRRLRRRRDPVPDSRRRRGLRGRRSRGHLLGSMPRVRGGSRRSDG